MMFGLHLLGDRSSISRGEFQRTADHPADVEPLVADLMRIGTDVAGVALGTAARALRVRPPPMEIDLAAAANVVDQVVPIRREIERRIGSRATDMSLGVATTFLSALTAGPAPAAVDLAHRVLLYRALRSRRDAWLRRETTLRREEEPPQIPNTTPTGGPPRASRGHGPLSYLTEFLSSTRSGCWPWERLARVRHCCRRDASIRR